MKSLQFIYNAIPTHPLILATRQKLETYSLAEMAELFGYEEYEIQCKQCGKIFTSQTTARKYCSEECSKKFAYKVSREKQKLERKQKFGNLFCKNCSKRIIGRARKFCDAVCRREYYDKTEYHKRRREEEKKLNETGTFDLYCIYCGVQLTGSQRKFCCKEHGNKYMTKTGYWRK